MTNSLLTWKKLQIILLCTYILLLRSMLTKTIVVLINIIQCNYESVELGSTYLKKNYIILLSHFILNCIIISLEMIKYFFNERNEMELS